MTPGGRGLFFYVPVLLTELFPWAPLVVAPLVATVVGWKARTGAGASLERLLLIWIVVFVAIFSFSRTKEDLYVFPIVPAVAALVAAALADALHGRPPRGLGGLFVASAWLSAAAAPVLWWLFGPSAGPYSLPEVGPFAVALGMTGLAASACWLLGRRRTAVLAMAAGFVVSNYLFVGPVLAGVERTKPVPKLARAFAEQASPTARLGHFRMALQSFVYYTDRGGVEEMGTEEHARAFFADPRESWALMAPGEWALLEDLAPEVCIAARQPLSIFDASLPDIARRRPPREVLLVRNHCAR
jgi:4-amino-4-deoxy-L-arabinose transferase-like glycosyltransferase